MAGNCVSASAIGSANTADGIGLRPWLRRAIRTLGVSAGIRNEAVDRSIRVTRRTTGRCAHTGNGCGIRANDFRPGGATDHTACRAGTATVGHLAIQSTAFAPGIRKRRIAGHQEPAWGDCTELNRHRHQSKRHHETRCGKPFHRYSPEEGLNIDHGQIWFERRASHRGGRCLEAMRVRRR